MSPDSPNNQSTATNPVGRFMVAAGAVIEHQQTGKILLVQRAATLDWHPNEWEVVYGRIDQHEDVETGLRRELREETGLVDLTVESLLTQWHIYRGPQAAENELIGLTFHATTRQSVINVSDEHQAYRWVTPEEALQLVTIPGILRDVRAFQAKVNTRSNIGRDVIGVGAGALIQNDEGKILLMLRGPAAKNEVGTWEIPGGAIEYGETIAAGLAREIEEELGVVIEVQELLQLCDHILPEEHQHWVSPTYICRIVQGEPVIREPQKCAELRWVTVEEGLALPLSTVTRQDFVALRKS